MDTVGCALGGAESPPAKIARAAASEVTSAVPSTVLISGQRTSSDLAAFANGVMIRYLDFNDTYAGSPTCHPSDLLAPVLAVVDARNGNGKDAILGTVLGYEVLCGLIDAGIERARAQLGSVDLRCHRGCGSCGQAVRPYERADGECDQLGGRISYQPRANQKRSDFPLEGMRISQRFAERRLLRHAGRQRNDRTGGSIRR